MIEDEVAEIERASGPPAWADVYEQHALRLTRLATLLVGPADAHDLVADAVLRAVHSDQWAQVRRPGAYLARTLVNLAGDRHRGDGRRRVREQRVAGQAVVMLPDVESMLEVRSALSGLTPPQLAVVYLHYWEDLTVEQAATQLDMRVGTARTHFDRAKRTLRAALANEQGGRR